jgi:hypothetical protein
MGSSTASVFPLPVGAIKRTFSPDKINGKAMVCGNVGSENPSATKALRTGLAKESNTFRVDVPSRCVILCSH